MSLSPQPLNKADILQSAMNLIIKLEGYRSRQYKDLAGVWTIGYGFTYWSGKQVTSTYPLSGVTTEECNQQLRGILIPLLSRIQNVIEVPLSANQYTALLSFTYNVGFKAFNGSTMLRLINQNKLSLASDQFPLWDKSAGKEVSGLLARRKTEQKLFNT